MEDKYIRDRFQTVKNKSISPRHAIWETIENNLKEEKRFRFQKRFNLALAASLVVVFSMVIFLLLESPSEPKTTAEEIHFKNNNTPIILDSVAIEDTVAQP